MTRESKAIQWLWVASVIGTVLPAVTLSRAHAAEARSGDRVVVAKDEIIRDDLYVFGSTIEIQGRVDGDVFAFGRSVTVTGVVNGDLMGAGGTTAIHGEVGGSVRRCGGTLLLTGNVGDDLLVAAGTVKLGPNAGVGRDVMIVAQSAGIAGHVGRNLSAAVGELSLAGTVEGDLGGQIDSLSLSDSAVVGGDLRYTSDREAELAAGASVGGTMTREADPSGERMAAANDWVGTLIGVLALGLLFVHLVPDFGRRTLATLSASPWRSLGMGVVLLLGVPAAIMVLLIVGLYIGGWWPALAPLAAYGVALVLGFVVVGELLGDHVLKRFGRGGIHRGWVLVCGLALLTLMIRVPILGPGVGALSVVLGLGALGLTLWRTSRTSVTA